MKNRYIKHTHISERKFREIIRLFCEDIEASKISHLSNISRNSINDLLNRIRERIVELCNKESYFTSGEIEIDESYFGGRRMKGKKGRGTPKTKVFGIKKRGDKVYTQIVDNCSASTLVPIIKKLVPISNSNNINNDNNNKNDNNITNTITTINSGNSGNSVIESIENTTSIEIKDNNHSNNIANTTTIATINIDSSDGGGVSTDNVNDNETIIYSDEWKAYDGLVSMGYKKHYRVKHSDNVFSNGKVHINGIENFWGVAKIRLSKFRGIRKDKFYLHLKETEFRFNHRKENLNRILLKEFRKNPL